MSEQDQGDTLTLKEVELDYEADEGDDGRVETPSSPSSKRELSSPRSEAEEGEEKDKKDSKMIKDDDLDDIDDDLESGEELEDGEISDEDETLKNERNEPKPICRFYSKGQCTWGTSCRFLHPGVLDKGNYSMFAAPRPILPGEPEKEPDSKDGPEPEPVMMRPPPPAYETAWERGLRQAKEMRRRSHKRREMDVEYEEKKASLSLTQIELDKENDYYTRPASPAHTHDPYADDDYGDGYDGGYQPESRRIAPPPPADFVARGERTSRKYSESPPPRVRRVAPPRSPDPTEDPGRMTQRFRGGEDWADPWMRSKDEKPRGRPRRRSYSSGSSRSSSNSSKSSSRSPTRRRRRYSSSSSSSRSGSRSRSSSPEDIPRRGVGPAGLPPPTKNTAPLQKRLAAVSQQKGVRVKVEAGLKIKQEGEKRPSAKGDRGEQTKSANKDRATKQDAPAGKSRDPKEPFKMAIPKNQIKLTLKTTSGKPANQTVLDKLGTNKEDLNENRKRKHEDPTHPDAVRQKKLENEELMETLKQRLKTNLENKQIKEAEAKIIKNKKLQEVMDNEKRASKSGGGGVGAGGDKKKPAGAGGDAKTRRKEELLKQLKAVEDAIHRKRTKLDK